MESSGSAVNEIIRREVGDWDDDVIATARFKAFSGQRSDWEGRYLFWKDLILKISRHLKLLAICPSQVKNEWFNRGGLTPLCLDHVLSLMYDEGDIVRSVDLEEPTGGRLSQLFRRAKNLVLRPALSPTQVMLEDHLIFVPLLKDKANEVVKRLSENHWTSSCIVTMKKFQDICGGSMEATAVLSYLSRSGKAQYLPIRKKEFIEGVKVSLSAAPASMMSSLDFDVLHLVWTSEKLQQQIDVIDQRYQSARKSAVLSLKSGNKKVALRHAKELKLALESREKCTSLLNRVEEVLNIIVDAETTKKVSEAIQIGAQAIKQNGLTVEDVELCLEELKESIDSQKQVEEAFVSAPVYPGIEDEDFEAEFKELQLEADSENLSLPVPQAGDSRTVGETATLGSADLLSDALSNLRIQDASSGQPEDRHSMVPSRYNDSKHASPEAA